MLVQETAVLKYHPSQEIFTHVDKDGDNITRIFLVGTMQSFIEDYPLCASLKRVVLPIDDGIYKHLCENSGMERDRIDRLKEPYLSKPCIGVYWDDDGLFTLIDGTHRAIKLYEMGIKKINVFVFKKDLWPHFILSEKETEKLLAEKDLFNAPSGVIEHENKIKIKQ